MNFEEFENLARLYVVGALEDGEEEAFQEARIDFGERAEDLIAEFRQLNSVFALSLQPHPPHPDTKRKLLQAIRQSIHVDGRADVDGSWLTGNPAFPERIPD
jgi:anti-sigma-K factor RskA